MMEFICFINIFYRYGKKLLENMLKEYEINMQELIVILVINESEGIYQSKLINFTGLDKGNFSKFLKQLEERDYIYKIESKDMPGQNECYLSDSGKNLVPYLKETLNKWELAVRKDIEDKEIEDFKVTSSKISDNLCDDLGITW